LDLILNFPGYHRVKFNDVMRNILKIVMSVAWCIILPLFYVNSSTNVNLPFDLTKYLRQIKGVPQLYLFAVALYLLPNILTAALFVFPMFRRWIENSDWLIIRFLLWWSQVIATMLCPVNSQQKKGLLRRR
jgi:callose synthase